MKLSIPILVCFFAFSFGLKAQEIYPAKVAKPILWLMGNQTAGLYQFENKTPLTIVKNSLAAQGEFFNFNPAIQFVETANNELSLNLTNKQITQQTLFLAYKLKDSLSEQFIWNLSDSVTTQSLATSKRMVNLENYQFKTYATKITPYKANIHFYQQNRSDLTSKNYQLTFGNTTSKSVLPPTPLNAVIAEILLYDRVLTPTEVQKVASYLAIKYGISLSQTETKNYLNSQSEIIWKQSDHKNFDNNITAIGRDNQSQLLQLKSSNANDNNLLTIGINGESKNIADNFFVFWSDNGKAVQFKKQDEGQPKALDKKWILDYYKQENLGLNWEFDTSKINSFSSLDANLYFWLKTDESGTGDFNNTTTKYLKLEAVTAKKLTLDNFDWDNTGNGKQAFTLAIAPAMFANLDIQNPVCGVSKSGVLNFKIEGGTAPYQISLVNSNTATQVQKWVQNSTSGSNLSIDSGNYEYVVTDANNLQYKQSIYISDTNVAQPQLEQNYIIETATELVLDAATSLPEGNYKYEWFCNEKSVGTTSVLPIQTIGDYELRVQTDQGCQSVSKFTVSSLSKLNDSGARFLMYPNPTQNGNFTVSAWFTNATSATVTVYNTIGQLLDIQKFNAATSLEYQGYLPIAGVYYIKVNSFYGEENLKLIVQ